MLDDTTVTAKTVNSLKSKLGMERKMKMGLFLDWSPLEIDAITEIRNGRPASILQISLTYIAERIGDSTVDDARGWTFAEVVYDWLRHEILRYTDITVFF